jgi:hypothetical protein
MSAYMVSDDCINAIATWITSPRHDWELRQVQEAIAQTGTKYGDKPFAEILGREMFDLNCLAIHARYGKTEDTLQAAREFRPLDYQYKPTYLGSNYAVYDRLGEWRYQCSEGNVPETSKLFQALENIWDNMAHDFFRGLRDREHTQDESIRRELRQRIDTLETQLKRPVHRAHR